MSPADDALPDMIRSPRRSRAPRDADVAALLSGQTPVGRDDLLGAAALVTALRALPQDAPAPTAALASLLAHGFDPATASPPVALPAPVRRTAARRALVRVAALSVAVKVLAGTGAAVAAVVTAASTGVLPAPVQDGLSGVLDAVTPGGGSAPATEPPELPAVPSTGTGPTELPEPPARLTVVPTPRPTAVPSQGEPAAPARPRLVPPASRPAPAGTPAEADRSGAPAAEAPQDRPDGDDAARRDAAPAEDDAESADDAASAGLSRSQPPAPAPR